MGLSWGGSLYPWKSAHVIATLVVGFLTCVAFVLYGSPLQLSYVVNEMLTLSAECYVRLKRPLIPMHLFKDPDYVVLTIVSAVGGMLYYSLNGKRLDLDLALMKMLTSS